MKAILAVVVIMMLPFCGHSLRRITFPTPVLQSIFDERQAATPQANSDISFISGNFPGQRLSQLHAFGLAASPESKRSTGITLLIVGTCFLAGAFALFYKATLVDLAYAKVPYSSGSGIAYYLLGILSGGIGLSLGIPGLVLTIKYRNGGGRGDRFW